MIGRLKTSTCILSYLHDGRKNHTHARSTYVVYLGTFQLALVRAQCTFRRPQKKAIPLKEKQHISDNEALLWISPGRLLKSGVLKHGYLA